RAPHPRTLAQRASADAMLSPYRGNSVLREPGHDRSHKKPTGIVPMYVEPTGIVPMYVGTACGGLIERLAATVHVLFGENPRAQRDVPGDRFARDDVQDELHGLLAASGILERGVEHALFYVGHA